MKNILSGANELRNYLIISFLFFLSFAPIVSSISLGLLVVLWIWNGGYKESFKELSRNKRWLALLGFYLFHVVSLAWSANYKYAFFDLQVKLSYLVCPIVFCSFYFSEDDWKKFRRAFIAGTTLAAVICLCHAFWQYSIFLKKDYLFYDKLSMLMHPTYFIIYLNLSMLFILYDLFWSREGNKRMRGLYYGILFFQLVVIFLLSSRTALATALITFLVYSFMMIVKKKLRRKDALPVILFFSLAVLFQIGVLTYYNRYGQITRLMEQPDTKEESSTSTRIHLWETASEIIKENPVAGVGAGDIKEELVAKYVKNNYEYGIKNRISPHNQYLHTMVILGATGLVLLLAMFLVPFLVAWRKSDWLYILFLMCVFLNALTESILERQAGILFFAFFNSLFASRLFYSGKTE